MLAYLMAAGLTKIANGTNKTRLYQSVHYFPYNNAELKPEKLE